MAINCLEIQNVTKRYAEHTALNNVSLNVPEQSLFGLLGPNGAGKTSLIRIITQITAPDSGSILFNGEPLSTKHIGMMGYLPEERGLYKKMKVGEQLLYLAQLKGLSKNDAMERLKKWFTRFDIKPWWEKNIEDLSKGMQQKVQFIATVIHEPKFIILDEPFTGFDPINAEIIKDEILALKNEGATILFSTHRMESVEQLCDYIALINNAEKILDGSVKDIKKSYKTNTYEFVIETEKLEVSPIFELINQKKLEDNLQLIQIKSDSKISEIIASINNQYAIHSFKEVIPSINDIFIKEVGKFNS
jgi:ABC-2 type transport system ATP-binding protein